MVYNLALQSVLQKSTYFVNFTLYSIFTYKYELMIKRYFNQVFPPINSSMCISEFVGLCVHVNEVMRYIGNCYFRSLVMMLLLPQGRSSPTDDSPRVNFRHILQLLWPS